MVPNTTTALPAVPQILDGTAAEKSALRARIRAERRERPRPLRAADGEDLVSVVLEMPEVRGAGCVALYASCAGEPDTRPLRSALRRAGVRVLLPLTRPGARLDWAEDTGELAPTTGPGGPEPTGPPLGPEGLRDADVVIVPALAVDTLGRRLGQGGGYYDRALPAVEAGVPVVAMVHEGEVLDAAVEAVPAEPHDVPVDGALTPLRCLRLPGRA
jgi:5-formyltetrahydrofolate cyclo-ligase